MSGNLTLGAGLPLHSRTSAYAYVISTNRAFDQESFIGDFLKLPEYHNVSI
jgi:hypothetical protein